MLMFWNWFVWWTDHLGEPDDQDKFVTGPDDTIHDVEDEDVWNRSIAPLELTWCMSYHPGHRNTTEELMVQVLPPPAITRYPSAATSHKADNMPPPPPNSHRGYIWYISLFGPHSYLFWSNNQLWAQCYKSQSLLSGGLVLTLSISYTVF